MSNLTYTRDQLVAAAKNACGITATGTDFDTGNASVDLVNDAIQFFANEHDWSWTRRPLVLDFASVTPTMVIRTSGVVTVTKASHGLLVGDYIYHSGTEIEGNGGDGYYYVASVPTVNSFTYALDEANEAYDYSGTYMRGFVNLPADFAGLVSLERNVMIRTARAVSMQRIVQYRSAGGVFVTGPYGTYYNVRPNPQIAATAEGTWRLEIFPTPVTSESAALVGEYKRIIPTLAASTSIPDIGPGGPVHTCLKTLCRAMAISTEEERAGEDWRRYERMLAQCVVRDGDQQTNLGDIEGGVDDPAYGAVDHLYPSVITP